VMDPLLMEDHLDIMEEVYPFEVAPWWQAPEVFIDSDAKSAVATHDRVINSSGTHTINLYTDGSGLDGKVGAAAVDFDQKFAKLPYYTHHCVRRAKKMCLGTLKNATVFAAELKGIELALDMVHGGPESQLKYVNIFTDNQAALQRIRRPKWCSGQVYLHNVIEKLDHHRSTGLVIRLHWIPAHIGVPGNEAADEAARMAGTLPPEPSPILRSAVKMQVQQRVHRHWATSWEKSSHGRMTYDLEPRPDKKVLKKHRGLRKAESSMLIQARTGKISVGAYLFSIGRAADPYCSHCPGTRETIRHVLIDCPEYLNLRYGVFGDLLDRDKRYFNRKAMLSDPALSKQVTNFLFQTQLFGQFFSVPTAPAEED